MARSDVEISIGLELRDINSKLDKLKGDIRSVGTSGTKSMGGLSNSMKSFAKVAGTAAAAFFAFKKGFDLSKEAARVEDARKIFKATGGSIEELRKATKGLISDSTLMKQSNLANSMGISHQDFEKLGTIAVAAAKKSGESVEFMLESISKGTARSSKLLLDNLGINVTVGKANERYAKQLGKTAKALTDAEKRQAFLNMTVAEGGKIIAEVAKAGANSAEPFDRLASSWDNFKTAVGNSSAVKDFFSTFAKLTSQILTDLVKAYSYQEKLNQLQAKMKAAHDLEDTSGFNAASEKWFASLAKMGLDNAGATGSFDRIDTRPTWKVAAEEAGSMFGLSGKDAIKAYAKMRAKRKSLADDDIQLGEVLGNITNLATLGAYNTEGLDTGLTIDQGAIEDFEEYLVNKPIYDSAGKISNLGIVEQEARELFVGMMDLWFDARNKEIKKREDAKAAKAAEIEKSIELKNAPPSEESLAAKRDIEAAIDKAEADRLAASQKAIDDQVKKDRDRQEWAMEKEDALAERQAERLAASQKAIDDLVQKDRERQEWEMEKEDALAERLRAAEEARQSAAEAERERLKRRQAQIDMLGQNSEFWLRWEYDFGEQKHNRELYRLAILQKEKERHHQMGMDMVQIGAQASQSAFSNTVSLAQEGIDMMISGEEKMLETLGVMALARVGQELVALGTMTTFKGAAYLIDSLGTDPRAYGMIALGGAMVAGGIGMGAAATGLAKATGVGQFSNSTSSDSVGTRSTGFGTSASSGQTIININYGVAGPDPDSTAKAVSSALRLAQKRGF